MPTVSAKASGSTRPEDELLVCCARTHMDAETAARMKSLLRQDIDWEYLLRAAPRQGIMPLLYWHLNATCPEAVPRATLDHLRDFFHSNTQRNLFLTGELSRVLNLFEAHRIPVIPLKGPLLAASVYGNLALRQFADLDVLVHEGDVLRARELLVSDGYRPASRLTRSQEAAIFRYDCEYMLVRGDDSVALEIHWRIVERWFSFPLTADHLSNRLQRTSLGGREPLTVAPEDLLLILCVHSTKHMWTRLSWICDVAELVRAHPQMDWGLLMARARELGGERMLFLGLFLASDLLGATLPEKIWQRVQAQPTVRSLAAQVRQLLFRKVPDGPIGYGWPGYYERSLFYLRAMERLGDRVRYCLRYATTPTQEDWDVVTLPDPLFGLYYLLRPIRLSRWFPRWLWKRLLGGNKQGRHPMDAGTLGG